MSASAGFVASVHINISFQRRVFLFLVQLQSLHLLDCFLYYDVPTVVSMQKDVLQEMFSDDIYITDEGKGRLREFGCLSRLTTKSTRNICALDDVSILTFIQWMVMNDLYKLSVKSADIDEGTWDMFSRGRHEEKGFDDKDGDVRSSSGIGAS